MRLFIDPSLDRALFLGLVKNNKRVAVWRALPARQPERFLQLVHSFLYQHHARFEDVRQLVVVTGEGRYSRLRITAVFANLLHWTTGTQLFVARTRAHDPEEPLARMRAFDARCRPVKQVQPVYSRPPHITRPATKKR